MKYFIKSIYFIALFIAALFFFGSRMTETMSDEQVEVTDPEGCRLPIVSLESDGVTVNRLYGYTAELNPLSVRESFVSLEEDKAVKLIINERESDVRKLLYNVYDTATGENVAEGQISAFDYTDGGKNTRLKLECEIIPAREYVTELILITSESRRIYYYYRFKQYDEAFFNEKVNFVLNFSEACRNKNLEFVIPYLESTYRDEGTTYSHVDIYDSYYMVCWGDLKPALVSDVTITITELYKYIMVARLTYSVVMETDSGSETYLVTEKFRVNIGSNYVFLMNYERDLEASFDPALASIAMDQLKLGISSSRSADIFSTSDNSMMCFVRNHTLYYYNVAENEIITVFSMDKGSKTPSDVYDQHEIKILRMDENGDVAFMVYGYFNNGEYEGKTGVLLYDYYRSENRIKELIYIPISEPFQHMRAEMGGFAYLNTSDIFYFTAYETLYSYNLTTGSLLTLSEAPIVSSVFCREESYYAWQEDANPSEIFILFPEKDYIKPIRKEGFDVLLLFDSIGANMVCGLGHTADTARYSDGTVYYPVTNLCIMNKDETILKDYTSDDCFITDAEATDTSIHLYRVKKGADDEGLVPAPDDYILIYNEKNTDSFSIDVRVTKKMMDEYYISLPYGYYLNALPQVGSAKITVIASSTTVRIDALETNVGQYEIYSYGEILGIRNNLTEAIKLADSIENIGVVTDSSGFPIWERGVMNKNASVSKATVETAKGYLANGFSDTISLTGATLSEVLYYVYKDLPVYAMPSPDRVIIITEYTPYFITYIDRDTGLETSDPIEFLTEELRLNGNVFWVITDR